MPKDQDKLTKATRGSSADKKTVQRSSKSGQFVTDSYAKKHPATTEKERVRTDPTKPKKSK